MINSHPTRKIRNKDRIRLNLLMHIAQLSTPNYSRQVGSHIALSRNLSKNNIFADERRPIKKLLKKESY